MIFLLICVKLLLEKMMQTGDRYEVDIRGCSIWATEVGKMESRVVLHVARLSL